MATSYVPKTYSVAVGYLLLAFQSVLTGNL